jgi:hypothetical protein
MGGKKPTTSAMVSDSLLNRLNTSVPSSTEVSFGTGGGAPKEFPWMTVIVGDVFTSALLYGKPAATEEAIGLMD